MNRRACLAILPLASGAAQTNQPAIRARFIGVWKLVSSESKDKTSGEVRYPYGIRPVGRLTYDGAGRMSAQLMNSDRRPVGGPPSAGGFAALRATSEVDMREVLTGFVSYFGTFDIDESSRTVIHHVQACLIPSWVGADLRRSYAFAGYDRLILTASLEQSVNRLVWQRE